ncbi:MAG: hypothetical protein AAGD43_24285, partial [Pseudomonadota bacterium]
MALNPGPFASRIAGDKSIARDAATAILWQAIETVFNNPTHREVWRVRLLDSLISSFSDITTRKA